MATLPADDRDLDDAALWAVIDSAAAVAASYSYSSSPTATTTRFRKPLALTNSNFRSPPPQPQFISPPPPSSHHKPSKSPRFFNSPDDFRRPQKIHRSSSSLISELSETSPGTPAVNHWPINPLHQSPEPAAKSLSPYIQENIPPIVQHHIAEDKENFTHCLSGRFPSVSLFKDYQDAAMAILDKSDYTTISGNPFIKKSGWRKMALYFNVSFEIKDKTIEFDENRNVQRAEFVVRAYMHNRGGRFSDGWGSCERREKKFIKPNNDIPSTAETRAKNKACQDLLGIGQYRGGASHNHFRSPS